MSGKQEIIKSMIGGRHDVLVIGRQKTNADRIRAMSDEELAEFLCHWDDCLSTEGLGYNTENVCGTWICTAPGGGDINGECQVCALAWLKKEASE